MKRAWTYKAVDSWDECYERELDNHASNPSDEGTIWFADSGAEEKMIEMLEDMAEAETLRKDADGEHEATSFLDLGTGNGHLLFSLRDDGWTGQMLGVDYSAASIQLAEQINRTRQLCGDEELDGQGDVRFLEHDLLSISKPLSAQFYVLLDKGTFDAISLSSAPDATTLYRKRIQPLLLDDGYLIITSCNWTEAEVRGWIEGVEQGEENSAFNFVDRVSYPSFRFGGQEGQAVVTLCFQLKRLQ
jgi:SAM-dependent methyltransferase